LENKVAMDPVKVAGVHKWPTPESWTDVQAFVGFVNFYRRFIQDFSTSLDPIMPGTGVPRNRKPSNVSRWW